MKWQTQHIWIQIKSIIFFKRGEIFIPRKICTFPRWSLILKDPFFLRFSSSSPFSTPAELLAVSGKRLSSPIYQLYSTEIYWRVLQNLHCFLRKKRIRRRLAVYKLLENSRRLSRNFSPTHFKEINKRMHLKFVTNLHTCTKKKYYCIREAKKKVLDFVQNKPHFWISNYLTLIISFSTIQWQWAFF